MNILAISQARTGSTRLPGKVLKTIQGKTLLEIHLSRIIQSKKISTLIVATTKNEEDNAIISICEQMKIPCYRGSEENVLDRFYNAALEKDPVYIVRLTADCPLIDPQLIDDIIQYTIDNRLDYCSNTLEPTFPDGEDVEVFTFKALKKAWLEANKPYQKEHVTPYIWENSSFKNGKLFKSVNFTSNISYEHVRLTVDEMADFYVIEKIINILGIDKGWKEYADFYMANKEIAINNHIRRNEGFKLK